MKKTIIAAAVAAAVAAPAAFADVSISGMVNPELHDTDGNGWVGSVNTDLVFKASEDLGNGMKASAKYHLFHDDGGNSVADESVSLSGDFGTIIAGRFEPFVEGVFDAYANIEFGHDASIEGTNVLTRASVANGAIAYVSPTVNGFHVGVSNVASDDFSAANEVIAVYKANGLTVMALNSDADNGPNTTGYALGYKMGDLEIRAMDRSGDDANGNDQDYTMVGARYTMGSNAIAIGQAEDNNVDATLVSIQHSLSKNVAVYVTAVDSDDDSKDVTSFGLRQKF
jgi:predicted porin